MKYIANYEKDRYKTAIEIFLNKYSNDMIFMRNIFITLTNKTFKEPVNSRQIDHFVLMSTGIFMIEMKYWSLFRKTDKGGCNL